MSKAMSADASSKKQQRFVNLKGTAENTCAYLNNSLDDAEVYYVDEDMLEKCVDHYFWSVNQFKAAHQFGDDDLINKAKQAALIIAAAIKFPPVSAMDNAPDTIHHAMVDTIYALWAACNKLRVNYESIPPDVQDDLIIVIRGLDPNRIDLKLLILVMHLLEKSYSSEVGFFKKLFCR